MLKDLRVSAASLFEGGWSHVDKEELIAEYRFTNEEASVICEELEKLLAEYYEKCIETLQETGKLIIDNYNGNLKELQAGLSSLGYETELVNSDRTYLVYIQ